MNHKSEEILSFEVMDKIISGMKNSPAIWTFFLEA
jgi:hypothetical protein